MRSISISIETFAAIWADRQPSENCEDEIIARKFGLPIQAGRTRDRGAPDNHFGWNDLQYDVQLPHGFTIFRNFGKRGRKKNRYEAVAEGGRLRRVDTGEKYSTLNSLTSSIVTSPVNAWEDFWKYYDDNGKVRPLGDLRNLRGDPALKTASR